MARTVPLTLPPDHRQLVDEFAAIEAETERLLDPLDDEQFNWSPARGRWSIGQCFDHMNRTTLAFMRELQPAVDAARDARRTRRGPIELSRAGRLLVAQIEPPVTVRVPAMPSVRPTTTRTLKAEIWPEFVRIRGTVRTLLVRAVDVDLNCVRTPHPSFRLPLRGSTVLHLLAAHDRRHLWQAASVRRSPGFPRD